MIMIKSFGLALILGMSIAGFAAAQHDHGMDQAAGHQGMVGSSAMPAQGHEGMNMEDCICHVSGAAFKAQNIKDGVILTATSTDPAVVKKLQESAKKLAVTKDTASAVEMVTCTVQGTKMKKSQAFDSTEYKGKTYYFCCAECKPEFLKNPEKYTKNQ